MRRIVTMLAASAALLAAMPAHADELQARLLAAMRASRANAFAFQQTIVVDATTSERRTIVERYDPRRTAAERWTLVSIDGRAPTAKEAAKAREGKKDVNSYASLAEWFGTPARRVEGPAGYVVYRFDRLPAGALKIGSHDASADTQADAFVNVKGATPFVERVHLASTKPFRMMLVASVKTIDVTSRYALRPGGIAPDVMTSTMTGSLLGKSGQMKTTVTYTDVQPVR